MKNKVIAIVGPTASGKTELSLKLAKKYNAEIINADSRLIYKDFRIGTDKPKKDRTSKKGYFVNKIRHHLIDFLSPKKDFSVALYKEMVEGIIPDIRKRGNISFLVGGSPLYHDSIIYNYSFDQIKPSKNLRQSFDKKDIKQLASMLNRKNPELFGRVDLKNKRRLIRALEITERAKIFDRPKKKKDKNVLVIGVKKDRESIYKDIDKRVDLMIRRGLVAEARKIINKYGKKAPGFLGIGYRQLIPYFEGRSSREEVIEEIKKDTRRFAKRQFTWYRKDKNIKWVSGFREADKLIKKFIYN